MNSKNPPIDRPSTPGGRPIPITVVEKSASTPADCERLPGTSAHHIHEADAAPDVILEAAQARPTSDDISQMRAYGNSEDRRIPTPKIEKVDSVSSHGEIPGTDTHKTHKGDVEPDAVEEVGDIQGKNPYLV